jgi:hypothetical protein
MPNAIQVTEAPLDPDYNGTVTEKTLEIMSSGKFKPDGDKDKAARAIFEVIVGRGMGEGHENEMFLPLGRDITARVKLVTDRWEHTMKVFGDICNDVYVE